MAATQPSTMTRRHFLRRLARTAGAAGAGLLVGSCSGKKPQASSAPAVPSPAPAAVDKGGSVKWAEFYSLLTPDQERALGIHAARGREWLQRVAGQFEKENPGWQVTFEPIAIDQLDRRSAYDYNGNVDHDLVFAAPQLMARHRKLGDLLDLGQYVTSLSQADRDDLGWSAAWQAARPGGRQFAVPVALQTSGFVYSRDAYRAAGLDLEKPAATLDEALAAGLKLARPGSDAWGLGLYLGRDAAAVERCYAPLVWHFGGDIFDETRKVATLSTGPNLQAATWIYDLIYTHKVTPPSAFDAKTSPRDALAAAFAQGKAGQALGFGSEWIGVLQDGGLVSGCVPPTQGCKGDRAGLVAVPTKGHAGYTGGRLLAIHRLSRRPDMAFALLRVAVRAENLAAYPEGLPARLSAWQGAAYRSPFYQAWLAAARAGRSMPPTPYYQELADTITAALAAILGKKADIAATLASAEEEWNSSYSGE